MPDAPKSMSEEGTTTRIHMCLNVCGAIRNRDWGWVMHEDGTAATPDEALDFYLDHLKQGYEVIPIGECDDFDFKTGCNGHPVTLPAGDEGD